MEDINILRKVTADFLWHCKYRRPFPVLAKQELESLLFSTSFFLLHNFNSHRAVTPVSKYRYLKIKRSIRLYFSASKPDSCKDCVRRLSIVCEAYTRTTPTDLLSSTFWQPRHLEVSPRLLLFQADTTWNINTA